jgi:alpha-mannosidase
MMNHDVRWTTEKIANRLAVIAQHVYRRRCPLPAFYAHMLPDTEPENPLVNPQIDDRSWPVVEPYQYWGRWHANFTLRTTFCRPADWSLAAPAALYLPIGVSGDFSHPEALVYIDGVPYAGCDRHHQEMWLPDHLMDGDQHLLALHGWTGRGGDNMGVPGTQLFMRPCELVQIDQAARGLLATTRVMLGAVKALDVNAPARALLLNALDEAFKLIDLRAWWPPATPTSTSPGSGRWPRPATKRSAPSAPCCT